MASNKLYTFCNKHHTYLRVFYLMQYNPPTHTSLDILFKDQYLLVINKPSGLLSVPGRGYDKQDCFISRIQTEYPDALIVHRLDMSTSGLMMKRT